MFFAHLGVSHKGTHFLVLRGNAVFSQEEGKPLHIIHALTLAGMDIMNRQNVRQWM